MMTHEREHIAFYCMSALLICLLLKTVIASIGIVKQSKGKNCFPFKIITSILLIAIGVICVPSFASSFSAVSILVISGLVVAFVSEIFVSKKGTSKGVSIGIILFCITEILYTVAFSIQNYNKPTKSYRFDLYEIIIALIAFAIFALIVSKIKTTDFKTNKISVLICAFTTSISIARAVSLGVYNAKNYPQLSVVLILCVGFLLISNASFLFVHFKNKTGKFLFTVNTFSYCLAQVLFAVFGAIAENGFNGSIGILS